MISIRDFQGKDLDSIKDIHFFMWLQLQWHKDFHKEDAIVAVDEDGSVIVRDSENELWFHLNGDTTKL